VSDAGYTLAEMLAALVMIGLATGGLIEGVHVISQIQAQAGRAAGEGRAVRAVQSALDRLLEGQGPFDVGGRPQFNGSRTGFTFDCASSRPCAAAVAPTQGGARLTLTAPGGAVSQSRLPASSVKAGFVYGGPRGASETWPPPKSGHQTLRSVSLKDATGATLADVRLWAEQPRRCEFDVIAQACRSAPP
jgi:type II secretory pathway pseudopilin PulG